MPSPNSQPNCAPKAKMPKAAKRGVSLGRNELYDDNNRSVHGPSGITGQTKFGPYGGKASQNQLSAEFPGAKTVKPVPKP